MDKAIIFCMVVIWDMFLLAGSVYLIIKYDAWWVLIPMFLFSSNPIEMTAEMLYMESEIQKEISTSQVTAQSAESS